MGHLRGVPSDGCARSVRTQNLAKMLRDDILWSREGVPVFSRAPSLRNRPNMGARIISPWTALVKDRCPDGCAPASTIPRMSQFRPDARSACSSDLVPVIRHTAPIAQKQTVASFTLCWVEKWSPTWCKRPDGRHGISRRTTTDALPG